MNESDEVQPLPTHLHPPPCKRTDVGLNERIVQRTPHESISGGSSRILGHIPVSTSDLKRLEVISEN